MPQVFAAGSRDTYGMRRWNGWGDESIRLPLPRTALAYLHERAGPGAPVRDADLAAVTAAVPPSRLPGDPRIDTNPQTRVLHARGQSLPDWLALRFGRIDRVPDGVAFPQTTQEVRELLAFAQHCGASVIPYGGGTSVAGHINPLQSDAPVLTISLERMRRLLDLDVPSRLARFEAGVRGPDLEAQLRERGYTLGHFPQSFEYSTLGGWIATRSSGQQSLKYGRIEQLFAGARVETPAGTLDIPTFPASAAGIDIREMILGSEGRLGIITQASVRVRPVARHESFHGWFFPDWEHAERAVHALVHAEVPLSMIRLANEMETLTTLRMAGHAQTIALIERLLAVRGCRERKCLLIVGVNGSLGEVRRTCRAQGGVYFGKRLGEKWRENRFRGVYLRNSLWENGYAVDTVETAVDWPRVRTMMRAIQAAGERALDNRVHAYTHLSHVYPQGSSVYSTFIFPLANTYEENLARWRALKSAVSETIVANGGTISHQHGVGVDHQPYLRAEKGELGIGAMRALFARFDPDGMLNPGKLC
ncbi:MAG TPA: FAD-binding oxidoreductase [Candidatus Baltobacteraceae bacterium]|nr:FAD-binding oxidoreductase [Candidatus Baltobacteraceae bacterium]